MILGLISLLAVVILLWAWREFDFRTQRSVLQVESKYLLREADEQRTLRRDKATLMAEAMIEKQRLEQQDIIHRKEEWMRMWQDIFETSFFSFNESLDEKGKFIWQDAAERAMDMSRHRGFTLGQVKSIRSFARALKKAIQDEQRMFEAACPAGEIKFDAEGGLVK